MPKTKEQIHEDMKIRMQIFALEDAGRYEEAETLRKAKIPMPAWGAKVMKKFIGADWLKQSGYDLSLAEAKFGKDWLAR